MSVVVTDPQPRVVSLATAVPPNRVPQEEAVGFFERIFDAAPALRRRLRDVYTNAEIDSRYAAAPVEWYEQGRSFEQKNERYIRSALDLLKEVAEKALADAGMTCADVDMIITVSSTGIALPALDARLMEELPFRRNVQRLPLFGLGCAGGALGLARAGACARSQPGSRILFLVVELCTLTFCQTDRGTANVVATALFGDGAAGAVLTTDGAGPALAAWGEHTWEHSLDVMGWHVTGNGLEVRLSRGVPEVAKSMVRPVTEDFLKSVGFGLGDIDRFLCHPGGAKVLDGLEAAFELPAGGLAESRAILREYGNMSAVTVLFILHRALETARAGAAAGNGGESPAKRYLLTGLGPGFSIGFVVLEAH